MISIISTPSRDSASARGLEPANERDTMQYLRELIERLGKALGIKPATNKPAATSTNPLGPVQEPEQPQL